jgi:hypothetical protein
MQELQVQIICANTPQAKGRVERANQTLLPEFMDDFNRRFAVQPKSSYDAHRPLSNSEDLTQIFTWQESRILSKNLTLQFRKIVYQIQLDRPSYAMRKASVTITYKGKSLPFTTFHKQSKQSEIVQSKSIDHTLKYKQMGTIPPPNHPWRNYPNKQNPLEGNILS